MDQETFRNKVFVLKDEMFRFARRYLSSVEESEDLVQELMMKFWQAKAQLAEVEMKPYAMKCVKNECLNRLKHNLVKQNFAKSENPAVQRYQPEMADFHEKIIGFINSLPEKQRAVMHLKDVEEYDTHEICSALGMEANAVRVNLQRARQKVREQISALLAYENRTL